MRILTRGLALWTLSTAVVTTSVYANEENSAPQSRTGAELEIGNVVFFHPDGSALQQWNAARMYWEGPDAVLSWDRLPWMAVYRGHMADRLTGTSNGGATTHAFGYKVTGPNSYGRDNGRSILSLSDYPGSISREAANRGYPTGLVNDGDIAGEPGTGAFFAETDTRGEPEFQSLQLLAGRPGFNGFDGDPALDPDITDGEEDPVVILGGGERFFLPQGLPYCGDSRITLRRPRLDCFVHFDALGAAEDVRDGLPPADAIMENGPARADGRNLLMEAVADDYVVIRTRRQYNQLMRELRDRPDYAPKVLGVFAADDIFNDRPEERVAEAGLLRDFTTPIPPEVRGFPRDLALEKIGNLVVWGTPAGEWGPEINPSAFNTPNSVDPPSVAELTRMALIILNRRSEQVGKPFHVVIEAESTDNLPNNTNAIGTLRALKRADNVIREFRRFDNARGPYSDRDADGFRSLILTAADSDGGALQVLSLNRADDEDAPVGVVAANPLGLPGEELLPNPLDGIGGREIFPPFKAEPDALFRARPLVDGQGSTEGAIQVDRLRFAVSWPSGADVAGGIISRAQGPNAQLLQSLFSVRFDNTDAYRLQYATLFGRLPPRAIGDLAPDR
ncbi:MAG: alkaline phosphatase [Myxococcota bacterium]